MTNAIKTILSAHSTITPGTSDISTMQALLENDNPEGLKSFLNDVFDVPADKQESVTNAIAAAVA